MLKKILVGVLFVATTILSGRATAAPLVDPGFEAYTVAPGGFVKPTSGPWSFTNDAGVVEPFSPNSSTGALDTWSATRAAYEGEQYVSTYAGGDRIRQTITIDTPGTYELSVYAFNPGGHITIPGSTNAETIDGTFRFFFGSLTGPTFTVTTGSDWTRYATQVQVTTTGPRSVGLSNTLVAPYFINYDAFDVQAVPEPSTAAVMSLAFAALTLRRRRVRRPAPAHG